MIDAVLAFLKNRLNSYLIAKEGLPADAATANKVEFIDGEKIDPISFKPEAVTVLLINVEEEKVLRGADPFTRVLADGTQQRVQPDIRLNLYVLFVAKFKQYERGLGCLSSIIQFFQSNRLFTQTNAPDLEESIEKLSLELITVPFNEQNEIWGSLRTTYHPSVLYKVKMLLVADENAIEAGVVTEKNTELGNKSP